MYLAWEVFLLASKSRQVRRSTKCQKVEKAPKSGQADHHDGAQNQAWKKGSAKAAGMRNGTRLPERAVRNQSCISHHHLLQSPQRTDSQTRPRIPTMAATRFFLAPVSGALVAASLLYTFRHTIAVRTHDTVVNLNDVKHRLDTIDPDNWDKQGKEKISQERLRPAYVPPQKPSVSEEIKARWNVSDPLSICFGVAGTRPRLSLRMHCSLLTLNLSVVLGLVAVSQEHLSSAVSTVANANYYELVANGLTGAKSLVSSVGSAAEEQINSSKPGAGSGFQSGLVSTEGLSLRDNSTLAAAKSAAKGASSSVAGALGFSTEKRNNASGLGRVGDGGQGHIYYLGEGTSLR